MVSQIDQTLRADREALLAELASAGATVKGPNAIHCPFHTDAHPSSGVYQGDDGIWRFKCHGCGFHGDIYDVRAKAAGRSLKDVLAEAGAGSRGSAPAPSAKPEERPRPLADIAAGFGRKLAAKYEYANPDTRRVELVVFRLQSPGEKKTFLQARPEGDGFILKSPPDPKPLYNRGRIRSARRVVVVEGEKCVHALHAAGIIATTSPMGAGKAAHADWTCLAGKTVYLWPDNDEKGVAHMQDVAAILEGLEPRPTVYRIDPVTLGLPPKGDVVEYLAEHAGATADQQRLAVEAVLQDAEGTGPAAEVGELIEDTISGRRRAIEWPWPMLGRLTRALLPGTVTILCGDAGARKSFALLQAAAYWHERGVKVALYELEEDRRFHMLRVLAQRAGLADLTDDEWVRRNPDASREAWREHQDFLDSFGRRLHVCPDEPITLAQLEAWIDARAAEGAEIVAVDPVTAAATGREPWIDDLRFVMSAKRAARRHDCRIVLVTHPKKGRKNAIGLDELAGGASYTRFSQTVLWLERRDAPLTCTVRTPLGPTTVDGVDSVLRIAKARNGPGAGFHLACTFDRETLLLCEHGVLVKDRQQ